MANKIRLGFVGANVRTTTWAPRSHFPALLASPDIELTAVCTRNAESAEEARQTLGAKLAFSDYREMVASPDIDAVAVVVKVNAHHAPTQAAIEAGKHVFTEWPLGVTTQEAQELAALARAKGVQTAIGLQARVTPPLLYMKELIDTGYVGEVVACHTSAMRLGDFERPSSRIWQADAAQGGNALTIYSGHIIDALRFVAGDFVRVGGSVSTQFKQWLDTDTKQKVDATAPDQILINGVLENGTVASVHVGMVPWANNGYRLEVYGKEGSLVASSDVSSQMGKMLRLQGAKRNRQLEDLPVPDRFNYVPNTFPSATPFNVAQMYALFARAIREGRPPKELPTFDTAVGMHHLLDDVRQLGDQARGLPVATWKSRQGKG